MKTTTFRVATVLLAAATFIVPLLAVESSAQKRTPPPSNPPAAQSGKPAPGTPPAKAVPRTPARPRPPVRPAPGVPAGPRGNPQLVYPYYFHDFDFAYRFPYGIYPFSNYPYPPWGYPVPVPGCVTAEGETEGSGTVRLDVPQTAAAVYVDGFYVGVVEDFNGPTEQLTLTPGPHHLELRAAGYQTLMFDVNIVPGKTITYRTPMEPAS